MMDGSSPPVSARFATLVRCLAADQRRPDFPCFRPRLARVRLALFTARCFVEPPVYRRHRRQTPHAASVRSSADGPPTLACGHPQAVAIWMAWLPLPPRRDPAWPMGKKRRRSSAQLRVSRRCGRRSRRGNGRSWLRRHRHWLCVRQAMSFLAQHAPATRFCMETR
jgi:hypothetical protein